MTQTDSMESDKPQPEAVGTTYAKILDETGQSPRTRQELLKEIEKLLKGRRVLSYFTSFVHFGVDIQPIDADVIESIIQKMDLDEGLSLVINSPGGNPLAAERIVRVCRKYSSDNFEVIVPRSAKSAATIICLGSNKIWMGPTSELGPIDPQFQGQSVWSVINAYDELMKTANETDGNVEPYLLQLTNLPFDAGQIQQMKLIYDLAPDVAVKLLQTGMMKGVATKDIETKLKLILDPEETKTHGRPIFREQAREMGLTVESIRSNQKLWGILWELFERANWYVSHQAAKTIESIDQSFSVSAPQAVG